jgi:small-conductance mechanosensitive channel
VGAYAIFRVGLTGLLVALSSPRVRRARVISIYSGSILRGGRLALGLAAALTWAGLVLDAFGALDEAQSFLALILTTPLTLRTVSISLADVLGFGLTVALALGLSQLIRVVLDEDVLPRFRLGRGVGAAISATARYVILVGGFVLALGAAGIDLSRFTILAGAFGVGIGFGLQNIVNNFVSGLILLYERPVQMGDVVQMGDLLGSVTRIGIRSSTLRTFAGSEVIVPNANLISEQLVNWTLSDPQRRIDIPVGVAYGTDPEKVLQVLREATRAVPYVLADPEPTALFRGFGDSALNFEVRFWTTFDVYLQAQSAVTTAVCAALAREGIEIPFPQRDLHLRSVDAEVARRVAEALSARSESGDGD